MSQSDELKNLFAELKKDYVASLPTKLEQLKKFLAERNLEDLENEFHKYKGSGKTYGVPEVTELCQVGEQLCTQESPNWQKLQTAIELFAAINEAYQKDQPINLKSDPRFSQL